MHLARRFPDIIQRNYRGYTKEGGFPQSYPLELAAADVNMRIDETWQQCFPSSIHNLCVIWRSDIRSDRYNLSITDKHIPGTQISLSIEYSRSANHKCLREASRGQQEKQTASVPHEN